jgi:hypothetical protein
MLGGPHQRRRRHISARDTSNREGAARRAAAYFD